MAIIGDISLKKNQAFTSATNSRHTDFAIQQAEKELNDRIAERFFVKRTRRSLDLSTVSKQTSMMKLKIMSAKIDQAMKRRGFVKNPYFFLGPKVASSPEERKMFATPKRYICDCCNSKLFNISAYIKHLKKHKVYSRCLGCYRIFDQMYVKKRHELTCPKKKCKLKF